MKILLVLLFLSTSAFAQVMGPVCPACPTCQPCVIPAEEESSATHRDDSFGTVLGGYQLYNTWVPNKYTGSYTQILNRDWSIELEYATSEDEVEVAGTEIGSLR